jgi:superfamily I DNA/RNA helicase
MRNRLGRPFSPLLIIAGAGTEKTKTVAHRVARLVLNERILNASCS